MAIAAIGALAMGIFSHDGLGPFHFTSIRGQKVTTYGIGLYKYMSAGVAPQDNAQDHVTLFVGVRLLLLSTHAANFR